MGETGNDIEDTAFEGAWYKIGEGDKRQPFRIVFYVFALAILFFGIIQLRAPFFFPLETSITIREGSNLTEVADFFYDKKIIRSPFLFRSLVHLISNDGSILAGEYYFHSKKNTFSVARIVTKGDFGLAPTRITIPEGATLEEIAIIYNDQFDKFDREDFLRRTEGKEGYLFPDTYFFLPNVKAEEVVKTMEENFASKINEIEDEIKAFSHQLSDVIIMASLLEKEARLFETRRIISGILWTRIEIGMALQVDAIFPYIIGKNTFEVTLEDLEINSPYNTYKFAGLPIGPIANPGIDSIRAAVSPIESDYLYYLSDKDGVMHYSETFEGHKQNKFKYLR